jgi:hypothetical protein
MQPETDSRGLDKLDLLKGSHLPRNSLSTIENDGPNNAIRTVAGGSSPVLDCMAFPYLEFHALQSCEPNTTSAVASSNPEDVLQSRRTARGMLAIAFRRRYFGLRAVLCNRAACVLQMADVGQSIRSALELDTSACARMPYYTQAYW